MTKLSQFFPCPAKWAQVQTKATEARHLGATVTHDPKAGTVVARRAETTLFSATREGPRTWCINFNPSFYVP